MGEVALTWTKPGHACPAAGAGQQAGCRPPRSPASSLCPPARDRHRLGRARQSPSPRPAAMQGCGKNVCPSPQAAQAASCCRQPKGGAGRALECWGSGTVLCSPSSHRGKKEGAGKSRGLLKVTIGLGLAPRSPQPRGRVVLCRDPHGCLGVVGEGGEEQPFHLTARRLKVRDSKSLAQGHTNIGSGNEIRIHICGLQNTHFTDPEHRAWAKSITRARSSLISNQS